MIEQIDIIHFGGSNIDEADVLFGISRDGSLVVADEDFANITVGDLTRARQAGLISGDLTDIGLLCSGHRAASLADSWAYFVAALGALKFVADATQASKDIRGLGGLFSRRSARRYARRFSAIGIAPRHLVRLIRRRRVWETARLALYLGISAEDAAQLLVAAGYQFMPQAKHWVCQIPDGTRSTLEAIIERAEHARVLFDEPHNTRLR